MNCRNGLLPATLCLCLIGCSADKSEAKRFSKVLKRQATILDSLTSREATTMQSLQTWAGREAMMGGPTFYSPGNVFPKQIQASREATEFAGQLESVRAGLALVSRDLSAEKLKTAYVQTIRSSVVQSLDARARLMSELGPLLQEYARGIVSPNLQFGQRPSCIDTVVAKISGYQPPTNGLTTGIQELRTKYSISDSDLTN